MKKTNRDVYFDNLKGFLILCVIIGNSLELANPKTVNIHFFILLLYSFHMPLFAFITGYFSKISKRTTKEKVIDTFKKYMIAQAIYTLFNLIIMKDIMVRFQLLMPQWTLWYLLSMIFWYIISDYIANKKKWIIWSIVVAMITGFDASVGTIGSVSRTLFFLPFYIMGMSFKIEYLKQIRKFRELCLILMLVGIGIVYLINDMTPIELFFEYAKYTWYYEKPWFPMFIRGIHYIVAILISVGIMAYIPKDKIFLTNIGKYSLTMYLLHPAISKLLIEFRILNYSTLPLIILSTIILLGVVILLTFTYEKFKSTSQ